MLFTRIWLILQNISWLTVQHLADGLQGGEPHSLRLSSFQHRQVCLAFAFPVFSTDRFACVMPMRSANSPDDIFLRAIITSKFTIIMISVFF